MSFGALQPPAKLQPLADRQELVDADGALRFGQIGRIEQRLERHDRPAGMGYEDDAVAALALEGRNRLGHPGPDVRRLDGIVEQDRQVAEPVGQEAVDDPRVGEVAQRPDGDLPQRRPDRQQQRA